MVTTQQLKELGISFKLAQANDLGIGVIARFFGFHDAHPVTFSILLTNKFGSDWVGWEPETLRSEILREFKAPSISEHNWSKIQATRTLLRTTGFWVEWHIFEKMLQALNNNVPRWDLCQKCSLAQLMAGVDIANTIRQRNFDEEVAKYVAACAIDEGITYLPPPLDFAQLHLSEPRYRCLDCGSDNYDDLKDGRCDYCVARYRDGHPFNGRPAVGVPDDWGRNIQKYVVRDHHDAKRRYEEVLSKGYDKVDLADDKPEDVQAAKLTVAHNYMSIRKAQLAEQMEELKPWLQ
jgi:hypothetical protein